MISVRLTFLCSLCLSEKQKARPKEKQERQRYKAKNANLRSYRVQNARQLIFLDFELAEKGFCLLFLHDGGCELVWKHS